MTLGRPGRGPAGRDDRRHSGAFEPWSGAVEIEELPAQPVQPGRRSGPGLGGVLAFGAAVLLLAAGLGFLGGRPGPTSPLAIARPSSGGGVTTPPYTGEPLVTPVRKCGASPSGPPGILLDVGGRSTLGAVDVLDSEPASSSVLGGVEGVPEQTLPPRVDVRSDIAVEVWTAGRACAVGWTIEVLGRPASDVLEFVANPGREPGLASQDRFRLVLADYAGQSIDLSATLVFPSFTLRAIWPIRILPFSPPAGVFKAARVPIPALMGCDVRLTLGNGWDARQNFCPDAVGDNRALPTRVEPGQKLEFKFDHADWEVDEAAIACGHLSLTTFAVDTTCRLEDAERDQFSFIVTVPDLPGEVALALLTCGTQVLADATNRLCGTWYANLEVRG